MRRKNNARALFIAYDEPPDELAIQLANAYIFNTLDPRTGR